MTDQKPHPFIIPIQELLDKEIGATQDFSFDLTNYTFPQIKFKKHSQLTGTITYLGDTLLIAVDSDPYTYTQACVRCLTDCKQITSIDAALESFSLHTPAENDFPLLEQHPDGAILDITPIVEQELHFSADSNPLCRDDCAGLCPNCGIDFNKKSCTCAQEPQSENPFSHLKSLFPPK